MIDIGAVLREAKAWLKHFEARDDFNHTKLKGDLDDLDNAIALVGDSYKMATFDHLRVGDHFISWPLPGDNGGHGGFLGAHNLLVKIGMDSYVTGRGVASVAPRTMKVIKVAL